MINLKSTTIGPTFRAFFFLPAILIGLATTPARGATAPTDGLKAANPEDGLRDYLLSHCPAGREFQNSDEAGAKGAGGKPALSFMLNSQLYLGGIQQIDAAVADHFFDTDRAVLFTINNNVNPIPSGWRSTGGMKFSSFADFSAAISNGGIDPHVSIVIYDNEKWNNSGMTPHDEQIAPASFTAQFSSLAHHHCYAFMATPSRDLVQDQLDYAGGTLDSYYLANGQYQGSGENFPPWAAASGDVFDIQAQAHTIDGQFLSFTTTAAAQAVTANPSIKILVGISTNYGTAQDMYNAVISTYTLPNVIGYWINVTNTQAAYQQVVDFLNMLKDDGF